MSLAPEDTVKRIARDFDERACEFCDQYKKSGLSASSKILLRLLTEQGVSGKRLLELGCGAGTFSIEALNAGVSSAVGLDLSPAMVKTATGFADAKGYKDVAKFEVGDGAVAQLPESEIVVMDKVICCYPDSEKLIANACRASSEILAFVIPRNEGLVKIPLRLGVGIMNFFEKRKKAAMFYLHSIEKIDGVLKSLGFEQRRKSRSRLWLVFLYQQER